jgi:ribosomal protein RSM22 (predicted rRNA methylase)
VDLPHALNDALEAATADFPLRDLSASVDRLIARYRRPGRAEQPILVSAVDAAAYAAYRMPATWGAVRTALGHFADRIPGFAPASLADIGGGTGAAAWAAADVFPSLADIAVYDQVGAALDLGRSLAEHAGSAALRAADWQRLRFQEKAELPAADLVTVSYVLSELSAPDQADLVRRAAAGAEAIAVIEPGTPDGSARVLAARDVLLGLGMSVAAPCPHQDACPLAAPDWCHFASRINRSPLHRRLKDADLGHEDEKFSYVIATKAPVPAGPGRILRHPQKRKGLVMMQICTPDQGVQPLLVSKRRGDEYRAARDAEWGDPWSAADQSDGAAL